MIGKKNDRSLWEIWVQGTRLSGLKIEAIMNHQGINHFLIIFFEGSLSSSTFWKADGRVWDVNGCLKRSVSVDRRALLLAGLLLGELALVM